LATSVRTPIASGSTAGSRSDILASTLNANTATWWELTALPQVGEVTARAIVDFREAQIAAGSDAQVFKRAHDLDRVRGVGPRTVARVGPHLHFDPPAPAEQPMHAAR